MGSPDYYKYYAKAKCWITNSRLMDALNLRERQVYVQCWHGTPLKILGFDIEVDATDAKNSPETVRNVYEKDAKRYTYMLSPSKFCTEKFTSAFNLNKLVEADIFIEEGYTRNDVLVNTTKDQIISIKNQIGIDRKKKIILYAPT